MVVDRLLRIDHYNDEIFLQFDWERYPIAFIKTIAHFNENIR